MQNTTELYEIFEYYHIPFWQKPWFWPCIGVASLCILVLMFFLYKRYGKKTITAWDMARREIAKLNVAACNTPADFKALYCQLTIIIKKYLAQRYTWSTHEKTDEELVAFLEYQKFDRDITLMLKKITDEALWIKFANQGTLKSQADADIKTVLVMIERTTPRKA